MTVVDVSFALQIASAPHDHGYALYAAISRAVPALHGASWLGVHPLTGRPVGDGSLDLGRRAYLRLRMPAEKIAEVLPLAGAVLNLAGRAATVGAPTVLMLTPAGSLDARMIAIKLTDPPRQTKVGCESLDVAAFQLRYAAEIERQLDAIDIHKPFLIRGRRSLTVAGRRVVGFAVRVFDLNPHESLRLLESGLGGKRRMGCGVFRPTRGT